MNRIFWAFILSLTVHGFLIRVQWRNKIIPPQNKGVPKQICLQLRAHPPSSPAEIKTLPEPVETQKNKQIIPQPLIQPKLEIKPRSQKKEPFLKPPAKKVVQVVKHKEVPKKTIQKKTAHPSEKIVVAKPAPLKNTGDSWTQNAPINRKARPYYKANKQPPYPLWAKKRGYQGTVEFDILVNSAGNVDQLLIKNSSGHESLDKAAAKTVRQWKFIPAKRGLVPVEMWVTVPIRFELR